MNLRRVVALASVAGLLATACATTDPGGADPSPTRSAEAPGTSSQGTNPGTTPDTTPPTTTATPSPTVTTTGAEQAAPCKSEDTRLEPGVPAEAVRVEEATGDLDGDGAPDRLVTYGIEGGGDTTFYLRVVTDAGYVVEASLDQAAAFADIRPLGAMAIGDDREVAFVYESAGASAQLLSLWALHDRPDQPCALGRVTAADAAPSGLFRIGGSLAGGGGLECRDVDGAEGDELVVTSVTRTEDDSWEWTEQAWRWPGAGDLEPVSEDSGTVASEEEAGRFYGLDCPGLQES